jgi:hypothetical protein
MKPASKGALSGCLVWIVVFGILCTCLFPITIVTGSVTTTVTGDFVARTLAPYLCPPETSPEIHSYEATTTDENGFETPTTAYEMRCVDRNGSIVKDLGPTYAFIWTGVLAGAGLILAAVFAFLLATPAGVVLSRWSNPQDGKPPEK